MLHSLATCKVSPRAQQANIKPFQQQRENMLSVAFSALLFSVQRRHLTGLMMKQTIISGYFLA